MRWTWVLVSCVACNPVVLPDLADVFDDDLQPFSLTIDGQEEGLGSVRLEVFDDEYFGPQLEVVLWTGSPCNMNDLLQWRIDIAKDSAIGVPIDLADLTVDAWGQCTDCDPVRQQPTYTVEGSILLNRFGPETIDLQIDLMHRGDFPGSALGSPTTFADLEVHFQGAGRGPELYGDCFGFQ